MKRKKYFKLPSSLVIERMAKSTMTYDRRGILKRTKEIYRLFGPPRSMMFSGTLTADAYYEMINAYIFGLYISTVSAAHAVIESSLSFPFMFSSEDEKIAEGGLNRLISVSLERGYISQLLSENLHQLRIMRIAYFHSHVGLNKRGAMQRYLDKKLYGYRAQRDDALKALKIIHLFLNETSPGFFTSV